MFEPKANEDSPNSVPLILLGSLQFSDACLRTYAHPRLLRVAEAINGPDFTPFNEALFIKEPGVGAAVSWHQDGVTHWESEVFNEDIHGFNFMAQVFGSTAVNGVWVLPGSHKIGKIDIRQLIDEQKCIPYVCSFADLNVMLWIWIRTFFNGRIRIKIYYLVIRHSHLFCVGISLLLFE